MRSEIRIMLPGQDANKVGTPLRAKRDAIQDATGANPVRDRSHSSRRAWSVPVKSLVMAILASLALFQSANARTIQVGLGHYYILPSQAAKAARDGDVIEIDAGDYPEDAAFWQANNLTIRGVGGMAHMKSQGVTVKGKAIWVIKGNDITVEHIGFHDARVTSKNGAGIRLEGRNLTVRHSLFRNNENGILTGKNPESEVLVEHSEFDRNGHPSGQSHNLYIGAIRKFTLRDSVSRRAKVGHQVKSRAAENIIVNNRLVDEVTGNSSYLIDLPSGGSAIITGNTLQQGALAENSGMISFGAEKTPLHTQNTLVVKNNTFINDRRQGCRLLFVKEGTGPAVVAGNRFVGCKRMVGPINSEANNYQDRSALPPTREGN